MKIAEHFSYLETNWNKPISGVLKRTETWQKLTNVSIFMKRFETKLKQEENWLSPIVSVVSKRFKTKLKQALEKVKIPGPISGVSKHWNNGLYGEKTETDWNMTKID